MPNHVKARAAQDEQEEHQVRESAKSHPAPTDWKVHAQMVLESWAGKQSPLGRMERRADETMTA